MAVIEYTRDRLGLYVCASCDRRLAHEAFDTPHEHKRLRPICSRCISLGWLEHDAAPDLEPVETLRRLLAEDRRAGLGFNEIFEEDCVYAVRHLRPKERRSYLAAWQDTREAWRAAYGRLDVAGGLRRSLLADAGRY